LTNHRACDSFYISLFFFFSSRRRHTRLVSDWSSDVCSSDLVPTMIEGGLPDFVSMSFTGLVAPAGTADPIVKQVADVLGPGLARSEERRVGKECRSRGAPDQ